MDRRSFLSLPILALVPSPSSPAPAYIAASLTYAGPSSAVLDEMSAVTLAALRESDMLETFFAPSPFYEFLQWRSENPGKPNAWWNATHFRTRFDPMRLPA